MAGILKKIMPMSRSMSDKDFVNFSGDVSIALEYTGSPVNHLIPKVFPVDVDRIPIAKVAVSQALLNNLSLPVVEPIIRGNFKTPSKEVNDSKKRFRDVNDHGFEENGDLEIFGGENDKGVFSGVESSGTLGFSDSQDHSYELSESSDVVETPNDCNEIECIEDHISPTNSLMPQAISAVINCEEAELSDDERLECRRKKKATVTFCDHDSIEVVTQEESVYDGDSITQERPVAKRPGKKGLCYRCNKGNRFTEKEVCLVCDAKYCSRCVLRAMGSMPEGRKCLDCIGYSVEESKRRMLGKCSSMLKGLLSKSEVKQVMESEVMCAANQLPAQRVCVNGRPLCSEEMMVLRSCSNPPRCLNPGNYWYDRNSGLWGKEGHKPSQMITPDLNVGGKIRQDASNGKTGVMINNREVTKAELWVLQSAGVQCAGRPNFWVHPDGKYQEEGMDLIKGEIWSRRRTKLLCTLLALPTPASPNPRGKSNDSFDGPGYLERSAFCQVLLVGNDQSGTSTIYKQARVLYDIPFSEEERQSIKFMIQSNLYGYLGRLLEGRERFEEECLLEMRKRKSTDQPGSSAMPCETQEDTEYNIGPRLKEFSDWLIDVIMSGTLDIIFPAATREYAPYVQDLWNDKAIQATYSRRDELELPRVASYFLDRAVEIAKVDYEPSDTDILYAEGITTSNGLASMEFSLPPTAAEVLKDSSNELGPVTRCQLIRTRAKTLGENCKWLEMFEDVGIILFCVSLTEYDEYEFDTTGVLKNKMLESKKLFETIITHPTFLGTNFLLILNKFDLLEEKIEQVPLTHCEWFYDFNPVISQSQGSSSNRGSSLAPLAQRAFHYIGVKFKRLFKSLTGRKLYVCPVTALESDTVGSALKYAGEIVRWEEDRLRFSWNESSTESTEIEQSSSS